MLTQRQVEFLHCSGAAAIALLDQGPSVTFFFKIKCAAGKGIKTLQNAGIEVVEGVEEALCRKANEVFIHRMLTGLPFVTLRCGLSSFPYPSSFVGRASLKVGFAKTAHPLKASSNAGYISEFSMY